MHGRPWSCHGVCEEWGCMKLELVIGDLNQQHMKGVDS